MKCSRVFSLPLALAVAWFLLSDNHVYAQECYRNITQSSSFMFRYNLLSSKNKTQKKEVFSQHSHLAAPTDESAWLKLMPRKMLREENESNLLMMHKNTKNTNGFLKEISLHDVRIDPESIHGEAQQTNLNYLLMLDVDRLVWSFRKTAGLPTPGEAYGEWEAPDCELRGHFVGHYLSASAQMWASSHNDSLKEKMFAVVSALSACQDKIGSGYLSAFPSEFFDRAEALQQVWAPYYTIHKILAGLLDQHLLASNPHALKMLTWMVDYFYNRVQNVIVNYSLERHWISLNREFGGMNDLLYQLYTVTGDSRHLLLAHLFDKPCFLVMLALKADHLSEYHANTHIPIVIGAQMRYEVTGDPMYKEIGVFFMDIVNTSHTYVTGGTSVGEMWSEPKRLADTLNPETEESCTTYNMLKVARHLFRWTKQMAYADYYERSLTNGVLSIQRGTEPGVMIYLLPLGPGNSKTSNELKWGTKFDSFWCCYGTGVESFSKLGDSIYFEEEGQVPGLYIIQYISSSLNWRSGNILLNQKVEPAASWYPHLVVTFTVSSSEEGAGLKSTLHFRIPSWTNSNGASALLNCQEYGKLSPGNFLSITRKWSPGDKISLDFPFGLRTEPIKDDRPEFASLQGILYGPYVLAGLTHGDWNIKKDSSSPISDSITPIPSTYNSYLISLYQYSENSSIALTHVNNTISLGDVPEPGTSNSVHATFRIIPQYSSFSEISKLEDTVKDTVMLEPFDIPGMVVSYSEDGSISISNSADGSNSVFRLVPGLDGETGTVSFESESKDGCYVFSGASYKSGSIVKMRCKSESTNGEFEKGASFHMGNGISSYPPISFVIKGAERNFLLMPLYNLRDESYTVYFNITS